jgi:hypothetical protein
VSACASVLATRGEDPKRLASQFAMVTDLPFRNPGDSAPWWYAGQFNVPQANWPGVPRSVKNSMTGLRSFMVKGYCVLFWFFCQAGWKKLGDGAGTTILFSSVYSRNVALCTCLTSRNFDRFTGSFVTNSIYFGARTTWGCE